MVEIEREGFLSAVSDKWLIRKQVVRIFKFESISVGFCVASWLTVMAVMHSAIHIVIV